MRNVESFKKTTFYKNQQRGIMTFKGKLDFFKSKDQISELRPFSGFKHSII